jgi:hypothetical protein
MNDINFNFDGSITYKGIKLPVTREMLLSYADQLSIIEIVYNNTLREIREEKLNKLL